MERRRRCRFDGQDSLHQSPYERCVSRAAPAGIRGIISDFLGTLPGVRRSSGFARRCPLGEQRLATGAGQYWGFMLSPRQGDLVRNLLRQGAVRVRCRSPAGAMMVSFTLSRRLFPVLKNPARRSCWYRICMSQERTTMRQALGVSLELARSLHAAIEQGVLPRPAPQHPVPLQLGRLRPVRLVA